jgi:hypothetical protein
MLRARPFSSIFYSEMGKHTHDLELDISDHAIPEHQHSLGSIETDKRLEESSLEFFATVVGNVMDPDGIMLWIPQGFGTAAGAPQNFSVATNYRLTGGRRNFRIENTEHSHKIQVGQLTDPAGLIASVRHTVNGGPVPAKLVTGAFGSTTAANPQARKQEYTYVSNLRVVLDQDNDITNAIRAQLAKRPGEAGMWDSLGNGTAGHAIASAKGTGEIDLLALGFELGMGEHTLSFRLVKPQPGDQDYDPANPHRGGQIQYNLYID